MMKNAILLSVGLLVFSCSQKETKETNVAVLAQQIIGNYGGSLYCVDCVSIEYQIEINSDSSFIEHVTYLGREDGIFEVHGNWSVGKDSLITISGSRIANKIRIQPDWTLQIVNTNGNETLSRVGTYPAQPVLLNDIWVLETLNKVKADSLFVGERPRLEFHNVDKKIFGFGGCNQINGSYQIQGNQISIAPLIATRKACGGVNEALFLETIQLVNSFKIIDLNLYLFAGSEEKARFKKVD